MNICVLSNGWQRFFNESLLLLSEGLSGHMLVLPSSFKLPLVPGELRLSLANSLTSSPTAIASTTAITPLTISTRAGIGVTTH